MIGSGGFGVVYRARRSGDDHVYALKRLAPQWARDPEIVRRFKREIEIQASLDHSNIVPVVDYDLDAERGPVHGTEQFSHGTAPKRDQVARVGVVRGKG